MIDVQPYIDKLNILKEYMPHYVDQLAKQYKAHYRIIGNTLPFPKDIKVLGYDSLMEMSEERWVDHPKNGWSKPDRMLGPDLELRYLWKTFPPKPFAAFLNYFYPNQK